MSLNEDRILDNFCNILINTLKNLGVSMSEFFGENREKISIMSFRAGCVKLGYYESNQNEVNYLISKFQSHFDSNIIDLDIINNQCRLFEQNQKNEQNLQSMPIPVVDNENQKIFTGSSTKFNNNNIKSNKTNGAKRVELAKNNLQNSLNNNKDYVLLKIYSKIKNAQSPLDIKLQRLKQEMQNRDQNQSGFIDVEQFKNIINDIVILNDNENEILFNHLNENNPYVNEQKVPFLDFVNKVNNISNEEIQRKEKILSQKNSPYINLMRENINNNNINIRNLWADLNGGKKYVTKDEFINFLENTNLCDSPLEIEEKEYIADILSDDGLNVEFNKFNNVITQQEENEASNALNEIKNTVNDYRRYSKRLSGFNPNVTNNQNNNSNQNDSSNNQNNINSQFVEAPVENSSELNPSQTQLKNSNNNNFDNYNKNNEPSYNNNNNYNNNYNNNNYFNNSNLENSYNNNNNNLGNSINNNNLGNSIINNNLQNSINNNNFGNSINNNNNNFQNSMNNNFQNSINNNNNNFQNSMNNNNNNFQNSMNNNNNFGNIGNSYIQSNNQSQISTQSQQQPQPQYYNQTQPSQFLNQNQQQQSMYNQPQQNQYFNQTVPTQFNDQYQQSQINTQTQPQQINTQYQQSINQPEQRQEPPYQPHMMIDVRNPQKFNEINQVPLMQQFPIIQNRFYLTSNKINDILTRHQRYTLYVLYYKILGIFSQFGDEPRKRFILKDPSNKYLITKHDFYDVLNSFNCQLSMEEFNLILDSLLSRTNDLYNYDEFLNKVYNITKTENGELVIIYHECNFLFNDYLYNFRHYILDNKINYQNAYTVIFNNMTLMPYDLFKKFLAELNYNLSHEDEYKYLFSNICEINYLWNSVVVNITNNCPKKNLDDVINLKEISEEDFIKSGKIVKEKGINSGDWKKNIKQFTDSTKDLYKKNYKHLENMFKNIHENCIRYNVDNFVDYFDKANVDITNEGDINVEDFKKLMENIGISQNLTFQNVLNSFKNTHPSKRNLFKLTEFLSIYLLFQGDDKQNVDINVAEKVNNMNNNENEQQKTNEDESKYVFKNKHRKFTQDDIDHISELCEFLAGIIIDEKNVSVTNYFKNLDASKQGFITMNQLKRVFNDDLEIDIENDDSMNDFFDFVIADEKVNGSDVVKIDKLIQVVKGYSGRDLPNISEEKKSESINNNNVNNQFIQQENSQPLQAIPNQDSGTKLQSATKQNVLNDNIEDPADRQIKFFAHFINNNRIPFYKIFPSIKLNNVIPNQTISKFDLELGFKNANYPINNNDTLLILQKFDPLARNTVKVDDLKNEISKYEPKYFNEPYQNKNLNSSAINQSNLPLNQTLATNSAMNGFNKVRNYLSNNKLTAQKYFSTILNKNNGTDEINKTEFKNSLTEKNNFFPQFLDLKPEELEEMFEIMDENKDDKIMFLDIMNYFSQNKNIENIRLNKTINENINKLFDTMDLDHDELISREDFFKILKSFDHKATMADVDNILTKANPNNPQKISKSDFNEIIGKYIKEQLVIQEEERDYIIKLFKEADVDKTGFLNVNQLKYLFKNQLNTDFSDEQINKLCENSTITYDGLIDIEEFVNLLDNINNYELNNNNVLDDQDKINDDDINERIQNLNLNLNFNRKIHPKTFISLYNDLPLSFIPSFIRDEQKLLKLLPSSVLTPKKDNTGILYTDIKSIEEIKKVDSAQPRRYLNPISTLINAKVSFDDFASGVSSPDETLFNTANSSLKIVGRLLKVAFFNTITKDFFGNSISIDCQYKKDFQDRWYFEDDREKYNNNIIVRYNREDFKNVLLIFEFVLVIQKKVENNLITTETSCGFCQINLQELNVKKNVKLPIQGGTPKKTDKINPQDVRTKRSGFIGKLTSIFSGEIKSQLPIVIKPFKDLNNNDKKNIDFLPEMIIAHRAGMEMISLYRKIAGEFILNHQDYSSKVIKNNHPIVNAFCKIADCPDAFRLMVELWKEIVTDGATSDEKKNEGFLRQNLLIFVNRIYSVLFAEKFKYDELDPTKVPRGDIHLMEDRNNLINCVMKYDKNNKINKLNYGPVENITSFKPFSVDEVGGEKIDLISKLDELVPMIEYK